MMNTTLSPVFCNACGRFALAELDGSPLCLKCLTAAVKASGVGTQLDIVPLGSHHHSPAPGSGSPEPA